MPTPSSETDPNMEGSNSQVEGHNTPSTLILEKRKRTAKCSEHFNFEQLSSEKLLGTCKHCTKASYNVSSPNGTSNFTAHLDSCEKYKKFLANQTPSCLVMRILLKDIVPAAQNNIDVRFILLDKGKMTMEGQNKTCLTLVADETAAVHFQLWGEECDAFQSGDIIQLSNGIFSYQRNNLVLRAGKRGKIEKVGEFTLSYVETPNMSEIKWAPDPNHPRKYLQESVISPYSRIFPPVR